MQFSIKADTYKPNRSKLNKVNSTITFVTKAYIMTDIFYMNFAINILIFF